MPNEGIVRLACYREGLDTYFLDAVSIESAQSILKNSPILIKDNEKHQIQEFKNGEWIKWAGFPIMQAIEPGVDVEKKIALAEKLSEAVIKRAKEIQESMCPICNCKVGLKKIHSPYDCIEALKEIVFEKDV